MQSWLGTDVEFRRRPGGIYRSTSWATNDALGEFVEVIENEKVVFTFGWNEPGHPIPAGSTKVAITLIPEGDDTLVRLVHSGLPEDAITDHENGWQFFLRSSRHRRGRRRARPMKHASDRVTLGQSLACLKERR